MNKKTEKLLSKRKRNLQRKTYRKIKKFTNKPVFSAMNIHYEMSDRVRAIPFGGIGAIHLMQHKVDARGASWQSYEKQTSIEAQKFLKLHPE